MKKRITITIMVLGLAAALVLPSFVTAQEVEENAGPWRGRRARMIAEDVFDLSPDQEKMIEEFRKARIDENRKFREEMFKLQQERRELMKDPEANEARIGGLIDRMYGLRAQLAKKAIKDRAEWRKIFTPEQLEKMKDYRDASRGRPRLAAGGRIGMANRARLGFQRQGMGMMRGPGMRRFSWFSRSGRQGPFNRRPFDWRRR